MVKEYDAIIIGAGQAGPGIASSFVGEGKRVAMAEGDKLAGTCLNYGCRPTKALRKSAEVAHNARRAVEYGVNVGPVTVDFKAVMARMRRIIGGMQEGTSDYFNNLDGLDIYYDYAHFAGTADGLHYVEVGDDTIAAPEVYINTGARAVVPNIDGIHDVEYMTNKELLAINELPQHMIIIGGSYIGLEFGQMFRRFGSEITIIESAPHVASREDTDISEAIETFLVQEGVQLVTNSDAIRVANDENGQIVVTVHNEEMDDTRDITGSHLLIATGRKPNSDKLNLASVGLETDERGYIVTNDRYETNVRGIWALGDVNGRGAFTHTSYQDYEIFMANRRGEDRSADERYTTYAMFTAPPLGRVGMNEREARESGRNVLMATYEMKDVSRAQLDSETHGLIKVLVDADTEEILGAVTLGMQGDDVIAVFSNFMYTGASYKVMKNALPVHPTVAEFIPTILAGLKPLEKVKANA